MTIINRRAALGGVAAVSFGASASMAQPAMSPREAALWHMRELERLVIADGAVTTGIIVCGHYRNGAKQEGTKVLIVRNGVVTYADDDMLAHGGEA